MSAILATRIAQLQSEKYTRIELREELRHLYVRLSKEELEQELRITENNIKSKNKKNGQNSSI